VGRELQGAVIDIDEGSRSVVLSPRLLALRKAWRCVGRSRRISGRIVSADLDGVVVDLGGAKAFAPRSELDLDWLVAGPAPGLRFRGYVTAVGDALVSLSLYGPRRRVKRAERRAAALAAMTDRLDEPVGRAVVSGRVLSTGEDGAVVALEDCLITGFVPGLALESRPHIVAGSTHAFRIIGRPEEPDRDIDVLLWPEPRNA
jgi:ribosomal protein S1